MQDREPPMVSQLNSSEKTAQFVEIIHVTPRDY